MTERFPYRRGGGPATRLKRLLSEGVFPTGVGVDRTAFFAYLMLADGRTAAEVGGSQLLRRKRSELGSVRTEHLMAGWRYR